MEYLNEKKKLIIYGLCLLGIIILLMVFFLNFNKKPGVTPPDDDKVSDEKIISFSDDKLYLNKGDTYQLSIECMPEEIIDEIKFISSDENVAKVNSDGLITALNIGETIITAITEDDVKSSIKILVEEIKDIGVFEYVPVKSIVLNNDNITLESGKNYSIVANVLPEDATNKELMWETNDSRIATIDDSGNVTARTAGTTVLTVYSSDGIKNSVSITVNAPNVTLSGIEIKPTELTIGVSEKYQLTTFLIPANATNAKVSYKSSNNNIATVSSTGLVTGLNEGSVYITASCNGLSSTIKINVLKSNYIIQAQKITLSEHDIELKIDEKRKLSATVFPSNTTNQKYIWSSSNSNVVSVTDDGIVTANRDGSAVISVTTSNGKKDSVNIIVKEDEKQTGDKENNGGASSGGNTGNNGGSSSGGNTGNNGGSSTGGNTGNSGGSSTGDKTERDKPKEVILNTNSVKMKPKETKKLSAIILPFTASQKVEWVSGASGIVTVNSKGVITALKPGTTTIAAISVNGLVAKVDVTVVGGNEPYIDMLGNQCITPYTCFKQGDYGGNFCSTATCGTIAKKGCSITSWTIILSAFVTNGNRPVYDPLTLNDNIIRGEGLCRDYCSSYETAVKVFSRFGLKSSPRLHTKSTEHQKLLIAHLQSGFPALLRVGPGCYTQTGHLMAILAINKDGEIWLSDPASKGTGGSNNWISLEELVSCVGSSSWFILVNP